MEGSEISMKITKNFIYAQLNKYQAEHMGAVWNDKENCYRLPNTLGVLKELNLMGYNLNKMIIERGSQRQRFVDLKRKDDAAGDKRLRPYQRVDVNYLMKIGSAGIFNEQRTGKTPTTLVLTEQKGFEKIIVVAPASLLYNWEEEIGIWTNYSTVIMAGSKKKRKELLQNWIEKSQTLIVSYETLRNDLPLLVQTLQKSNTQLDCLIVDEAHRLRSLINGRKASQVSKAVRTLGSHAGTRYALTGTPTVKRGEEIWGILHFLYPDKFPGYWQFLGRYFEQAHNGFGMEVTGYKRKNELQDILSVASTNRKRADIMKWLPAKEHQTIKLKMNTKQAKVYKDVLETFVHEDKIDAPSVLAQLTRLRQISTSPSMLVDGVQSEKEKFILEWIADNPNESVVIFSTFSSYLEILSEKIKGSRLLIGKVSKTNRDQFVKEFQSGQTKVLLANIKAAGTGLTLDRGETVIFLDKEYNPSDNEQAEDRIVPVSEERVHNMHVISLVMKDTVDELINDLLESKVDITKVINNGGIEALERSWKEWI